MRSPVWVFAAAAFLATACGSTGGGADPDPDGGAADGGAAEDGGTEVTPDAGRFDLVENTPEATPIAPSADCRVLTWTEPAASREHLEQCTPVTYPFHPPAAGAHYAAWADFGTYEAPVPWGYLVHSLEHGAVVLAYDCPEGCPEVLAAFEAIIADAGADPVCASNPSTASRFVVVPDPDLEDGSLAAVAWEHAYVATCLDEPSLRAFIEGHYAQAPEDLCAAGLDASGAGWCD